MGALVALSTVGKAVGPLWRTFQDIKMRLFPTLYILAVYSLVYILAVYSLVYILAVYALVGVHAACVHPG